jgi:hypothetical protein
VNAIPPHLQKALDEGRARIVDQPKPARARPSRATAAEAGGTYRCCVCPADHAATFTSDRQAERHVNTEHGGGRYELVLEQKAET